jgi:hypothetical protein
MPVIQVNKVVDPKSIIGKGQEGGEAQGVADPKKTPKNPKKCQGRHRDLFPFNDKPSIDIR